MLVKKYELDIINHETRKSKERLQELIADNFFEINQSWGFSTKKSVLAYLPDSPEETFLIREYRERVLSSGIVLVHYIADREILSTWEKKCTLCSSIWEYNKGRWQMTFFQGTRASIGTKGSGIDKK